MDGREQFAAILADFGKVIGKELVLSGTDDTCTLLLDGGTAVNLTWLPGSEEVLAWASLGGLPEDEHSADRARRLLELNDGGRETGGFTISLDLDDRRAIAHDHRSLRELRSADHLGAWLDGLANFIRKLVEDFNRDYPFWDDSDEPEVSVHADN